MIYNIIIILFIIIWIIILYYLKSKKSNFVKFLIGSFGIFIISLYLGKIFLSDIVTYINLYIMDILTVSNKYIEVFKDTSAVTVFVNNDVLSYFITYECSGFIEMMVFSSLMLFYPLFNDNIFVKLSALIFGNIYLVIVNILRLFLMSYVVILFGVESFFFAHVILSRIFFIVMNIILYYSVFTVKHVKTQKIGKKSEIVSSKNF